MLDDLTTRVRDKFNGTDALTSSVRFETEGGSIVIEPTKGDGAVHNDVVDTDCVINLSADDLGQMLDGQLDAASAFMMGRLKVTGDMSVAITLSQIMKG
ncbi:MAG: SCP2 sterol-binding domain-containing protein [Pseudomonadota bacterium]